MMPKESAGAIPIDRYNKGPHQGSEVEDFPPTPITVRRHFILHPCLQDGFSVSCPVEAIGLQWHLWLGSKAPSLREDLRTGCQREQYCTMREIKAMNVFTITS